MTAPGSDTTIYRPGPMLAVGAIFAPVLAALALGAVALDTTDVFPFWLPLLWLLWIPLLPLLWLVLKSVRVDARGIAVARPWQRWREVPWTEVSVAEARLGVIRITGETGDRITFRPLLLRDGARLERALLLRLPSQVLNGVLRQRAQQLIIGDIYPTPHGGLSGMLRTRPRRRWRLGMAFVGVAGLVGVYVSLRDLPATAALAPAVACAAIALASFVSQLWLAQSLFVNEQGLEVALPFSSQTRGMRWHEVELIECTYAERLLRLRSHRRLLCPGPGLLAPADRNAMRAFIHEYCLQRKVPLVRRRWLI